MTETWEEAVERGIQGAVDQGFGRTITDPTVLAFIAGAVVDHQHRTNSTSSAKKAS